MITFMVLTGLIPALLAIITFLVELIAWLRGWK
jgi:hypothetical protein